MKKLSKTLLTTVFILVILLHYSFIYASDFKKILVLDENNNPIPFVTVSLSGTDIALSNQHGYIVLYNNLCPDSLLTFSHNAYFQKTTFVKDIKNTIHLTKSLKYQTSIVANCDMKRNANNYILVYTGNGISFRTYPSNHEVNPDIGFPIISYDKLHNKKADSFNPYGADRLGETLFPGAVNTLINLIGSKE